MSFFSFTVPVTVFLNVFPVSSLFFPVNLSLFFPLVSSLPPTKISFVSAPIPHLFLLSPVLFFPSNSAVFLGAPPFRMESIMPVPHEVPVFSMRFSFFFHFLPFCRLAFAHSVGCIRSTSSPCSFLWHPRECWLSLLIFSNQSGAGTRSIVLFAFSIPFPPFFLVHFLYPPFFQFANSF